MPPIRFRIRTMMAVIALVPVFLWARPDPLSFFGVFAMVEIVLLPTILVVTITFLVAVIVEIIATEVFSWPGRIRRWQSARKSNGPFRSSGPDQSGESKGGVG